MIREDSTCNISASMYEDLFQEADQKFFRRRCDRHGIDLKGMVHLVVCVAAWMGEPETDPRGEDC